MELFAGGAPPRADSPLDSRTYLEVPWHLAVEPLTAGASAAFLPSPAPTPGHPVDLWQLRLVARPTAEAAELVVIEAVAADAPDPFTLALDRATRARLLAETPGRPAALHRLSLSALGATLEVDGVWEAYAWKQQVVLGRDVRVQTVAQGVLYPTGHPATYQRSVQRSFDPVRGTALLRERDLIIVSASTGTAPLDPALRRALPFDEIEFTERTFEIAPPDWQPTPTSAGQDVYFRPAVLGRPWGFPLRFGANGAVIDASIPLLFVADLSPSLDTLGEPAIAEALSAAYGSVTIPAGGAPVDLVRAAAPVPGDRHEVRTLTLAGAHDAAGFVPTVTALTIALPAVRALFGGGDTHVVRYTSDYLNRGTTAPAFLELVAGQVGLDFTGHADRSGGLVAPSYAADAVSRTIGPVLRRALPAPDTGEVDAAALFAPEATILGIPIKELVGAVTGSPVITSVLSAGTAPTVTLSWRQVRLGSSGSFVAGPAALLDLAVTIGPAPPGDAPIAATSTECTITDFALALPTGRPLLSIRFARLTYRQRGGAPPIVVVSGVEVEFRGELQLLEALGQAVDFGGRGPRIEVTPAGITAGYTLPVPTVAAGVFVLSNVAVAASVSIPFDRRPVSIALGFASRANHFALTVLMFGGGGYLEIEITSDGMRRLDLALEFGALIAMDFVIATAEVHALGGVRFQLAGDQAAVTGYLRIGGSLDILGLVSVAVELCVELTYRSQTKALVGRATVVMEVDVFLWSDSIELDSGEWVLAGGGPAQAPAPAPLAFAALPAPASSAFDDYWYAFHGGADG